MSFYSTETESAPARDEDDVLTLCAGDADVRRFASSQLELAEILGVTRRTIANWKCLDGAPRPRANGSYDVAAWRAFAESKGFAYCGDEGAHGTSRETLRDVKLRRELLAEEKTKLEIAKLRGELVSATEVSEKWTAAAARIFALVTQHVRRSLVSCGVGVGKAYVESEAVANRVFKDFSEEL